MKIKAYSNAELLIWLGQMVGKCKMTREQAIAWYEENRNA